MTTTLQLGLAIGGGLVLVTVVAYNTWSARKNAPKQPDPLPPSTLQTEEESERRDPAFEGYHGEELPPLPTPERKPGMDALIDVLAPIALEHPVSGEAALAAMPPTRRVGSKPFAIEGLNVASQHWETPVAGQRYSQLHAGVQLANRTGALNEIEFSEFVIKTQAYADTVSGLPEFPGMREEVARGRELDQFANDHDAQLGFTLRAVHAAWSPGYVQQHAARLGFVPSLIPGRMLLPSSTPGMPPILGLAFDAQAALAEDPDQSALREVTLSLDVPQVDRAEQPFVRLRDTAAALAEAMDGSLTDDRGYPLQRDALDGIGASLEQLYDTLDSRELAAGSVLARRLFS